MTFWVTMQTYGHDGRNYWFKYTGEDSRRIEGNCTKSVTTALAPKQTASVRKIASVLII